MAQTKVKASQCILGSAPKKHVLDDKPSGVEKRGKTEGPETTQKNGACEGSKVKRGATEVKGTRTGDVWIFIEF